MPKTFLCPVGKSESHTACNRLLEKLANMGSFVVEVGELEGFARTVGGHGPQWVNGVLSKVVTRDAELNPAREFVKRLPL